jgi:hypothetical protein
MWLVSLKGPGFYGKSLAGYCTLFGTSRLLVWLPERQSFAFAPFEPPDAAIFSAKYLFAEFLVFENKIFMCINTIDPKYQYSLPELPSTIGLNESKKCRAILPSAWVRLDPSR